MMRAHHDDETLARPLVLVVGQPVLHDELSRFGDLDVHPVAFGSYDGFMAAMRERTVPMYAHPTVIVCAADLPKDRVGLRGLLAIVGDFMVVVGGTTVQSIPAPPTVNDLRAAIAATSTQQGSPVALEAVPAGDARIVDLAAARDLRSALGVAGARSSAPRLANQIDPASIPAGRASHPAGSAGSATTRRPPVFVTDDALRVAPWRADDQLAQLQRDLDSPAGLLARIRQGWRQ
jgi:hypothetical protein